MKISLHKSLTALAVLSALSTVTVAEEKDKEEAEAIEEVVVIGKRVSYANNSIVEEMVNQQSAMTSALAVIDNLPGVLINEGDTFGSDDWSTTVSIRGFQLSLDEQQIGITVDGIANGNSNYGGGAKANRYIDTENLKGVDVAQGTGDIASRSHEALGGTLNFTTIDPGKEEKMVVSLSQGDFDAEKKYLRYETGEIAKDTYAWASLSSTSSSDWIDGSGENVRDHFAAKIISMVNDVNLTAYVSYDDTHEDNYQRISKAQFDAEPTWDRLNSEWTGVPYIDQVYRKGWSTLRENLFTYLQAEYTVDNIDLSGNVYYHKNKGRGDWVPPYIVNVTDDGTNSHSELVSGNTVRGGESLGQIGYVDRDGNGLTPISKSCSSLTGPYGGTKNDDPTTSDKDESSNLHLDPNCFPAGSIPVGSYRHSHYAKERYGFNADFSLHTQTQDSTNILRGGMWYENYERDESRDWHKIIDSSVSFRFDNTPYWVQYDRSFNVDTTMFYLENELDLGFMTARLGAKKFFVELEGVSHIANRSTKKVDSDSDVLFSAGVVVKTPIVGLEVFAGYAENFAAIKDPLLEVELAALDKGVIAPEDSSLNGIKPETAENIDLGLRYSSDKIKASLTYYDINFEERLTFISADSPAGVDFLAGDNGTYVNVGGIESNGIEAALTWYINEQWGLYTSYTNNDSTYVDSIDDNFPTGNTVFGSVEELFVLSIDWAKENYSAGLSNKWVGDRWINASNTTRADGYAVADFYAGVSLMKPMQGIEEVTLRFTINNLTDESYLGGIAGQSSWIGAPRTAAVNVQVTF